MVLTFLNWKFSKLHSIKMFQYFDFSAHLGQEKKKLKIRIPYTTGIPFFYQLEYY